MIEALPRRLAPRLPILAALGLAALALRRPGPGAVAVVTAVGVAALLAPAPAERSRGAAPWIGATLVGVAAFAFVALRASFPVLPFAAAPVAASVLAAVAEEAFFRRFLYAWLARWGPAAAVGITALLFAVVHLSLYGPGAFGLNLAAGALLGWQRWASGSWTAPAATHAIANLLAYV